MGKLVGFGIVVATMAIVAVVMLQGHVRIAVPEIVFASNPEPIALEPDDAHQTSSSRGLLFVGDVLLARNVERFMQRYGDSYPFVGISLSGYEAVIANFEAAVPAVHIPTPNQTVRFSVASTALTTLTKAGITHVSLANNHSGDFGSQAFSNTELALRDVGLIPFGHHTNVTEQSLSYIDTADGRYALIALHTLFQSPEQSALAEIMAIATRTSDWQIAFVHWGDEYVRTHNKEQAALAHKLIDLGADLVIGHHPHVVQDIGYYQSVPIVYSLGNFVFDQYFSTDVQEGLLVELTIGENGHQLQLLPVTSIGSQSQPRLMPEHERTVFLQALAKRSDPIWFESIVSGTLDF